jgi:lipoprotein-releasing system permease protein
MKFELFIALRYLKARRKQAVISVITVISILGVAAGVMALIVALSISSGFREDLQSKLLKGTSHLNILPVQISEGISQYEALVARVKKVEGIQSATPAIYQNVLISSGVRQHFVTLKGLGVEDPEGLRRFFFSIRQGDLLHLAAPPDDPIRDRIAIGEELAKNLGVVPGDFVTITNAEGALTPFGYAPRQKSFQVVAIFSSGLFEFDTSWGFTSLQSAQRTFGSGDLVSVVECRVDDIYQVKKIAARVHQAIGQNFSVLDWQDLNRPIFEALRLEKLVMVITIGLIVFVASLNIITTQIMMVVEKNRDIAVLISMGATGQNIRRIFMAQGLVIGAVGATLGNLLGYSMAWACDHYQLIHLQADIYSISYVPFALRALDGLWVSLAAILISFLATVYPSKVASQLDPVEALRYE